MSIRETFWTICAAIVFSLMNAAVAVGIFARSAFETLIAGKSAAAQLRQYEDDLNTRE